MSNDKKEDLRTRAEDFARKRLSELRSGIYQGVSPSEQRRQVDSFADARRQLLKEEAEERLRRQISSMNEASAKKPRVPFVIGARPVSSGSRVHRFAALPPPSPIDFYFTYRLVGDKPSATLRRIRGSSVEDAYQRAIEHGKKHKIKGKPAVPDLATFQQAK